MAAAEHPIAGVISLLEKLEVEAKTEGEAEAATFQKFQYWCKGSTKMLTRAMKKEKKAIEELTDKIEGLTADVATLGEDIKTLEAQLEVLDQQAEKAKALRKDEHALYVDDVENLDGSIVATDEAIEVMEESEDEAMAFVESGSRRKHKKASLKRGPEDLLKLDPGKNNPFKPKAKVFSSHEGGVIETFKGLEQGWNIDKLSEEEQETNALNAYNLAKQARDTAISTAKASKAEKEGIKSDKESEKANAESSKAEQENMLVGDSSTLDTTDAECKTKAAEWDERTKIRNGELEAMAMAKKILAKVSGVRNPDEHDVPSKALIQSNSPDDADATPAESPAMKGLMMATEQVETDTSNWGNSVFGVSFLQADDPKAKAINLLRKAASKLHKKSLARLAQELSVYEGPFDKIKQMIQKMIFQLMAEQKDEDDKANWCAVEVETSTESKEDKTDKKTMMTRKVEEMDASIKLLVKQITENSQKVN